ncbi:SDR family NAD(P)-dependent oxidoreductase [Spirulina subsalsa]|uniref:SDR family NAD(P)-dependent oxidoreductase n=1 Tax=Spirulina subsalsa TaxID=54311 RepID=UPI0002D60C25|nr:SDR family NAD(P)-dependent oxidoreductase [Spirulina subsalsa]
MKHLQNKVALITGASRGIGRAIALELARCGVKRILLVARSRQKLTEVAQEIEALGVEAMTLALDLTETQAVDIAIARAWRNYGPIHILINCAGVAYQQSFLRSQPSQVQAEFSLNVLGTYSLTRLIARRMAAYREGTIVNVSSLMGKVAAPTMSTYSASKFALLGLTQALRQELAPYNIRVMALLPSLTDTDMVRGMKLFRGLSPMTPEQVAKGLVKGLRQNRAEIVVGWQSHLALLCQRFAPWVLEGVLKVSAPPLFPQRPPVAELPSSSV